MGNRVASIYIPGATKPALAAASVNAGREIFEQDIAERRARASVIASMAISRTVLTVTFGVWAFSAIRLIKSDCSCCVSLSWAGWWYDSVKI